ncbi:MAG: flagellin, partial [Pseudomonadota bacterium]
VASNLFVFSNNSFTSIGAANSNISQLTEGLARIDNAIDRVRGHARQFGSYASILQLRLQFTRDYTNELTGGADKLVLADLNEEGANLTALQTRQQLGIQTLRFATQQQQSILQLLQS